MGLVLPELSLDLKPSYVPEMINGFLRDVSVIGDVKEKLEKVGEFIRRLEDEMNKIQVFKRELPFCVILLNDAITVLKQEISKYKTTNDPGPVLEEFIPLKKEISVDDNKISTNNINKNDNDKADGEDCSRDKKNWMSSVQLWSADNLRSNDEKQDQPLVSKSRKGNDKRNSFLGDDVCDPSKLRVLGDDVCDPSKLRVEESPLIIHSYTSFAEFRRKVEKEDDACVPGLSLLMPGIKHSKQGSVSSRLKPRLEGGKICGTGPASHASNGQSNMRPGYQHPTSRKQRRCWSPDLHRRFVDALTKLGGPQVATPKQIRELMGVDGLTNDEVKSHLQKYRLHARRVPNNSATSINENSSGLATHDHHNDSSKPSSSQSGSPQGPFQFPKLRGGESMEDEVNMEEDEEDAKSESHSWKPARER